MNLAIYDYGAEYSYDAFDVTFSSWGYVEVLVEGTVEELPWMHADRVDAEMILDNNRITMEGSVSVPRGRYEHRGRAEVTVRLFATEYQTEAVSRAEDHSDSRVCAD